MRSPWFWPFIILISAAGAWLVYLTGAWLPLRVLVGLWFLAVCTGMPYVRLLRLGERLSEWTLAVALSLSIDACVAIVMSYARAWSPGTGLSILIAISLAGATMLVIVHLVERLRAGRREFANLLEKGMGEE